MKSVILCVNVSVLCLFFAIVAVVMFLNLSSSHIKNCFHDLKFYYHMHRLMCLLFYMRLNHAIVNEEPILTIQGSIFNEFNFIYPFRSLRLCWAVYCRVAAP